MWHKYESFQEYPINQDEISAGMEGILIGRYPGDSYAGGNPWQLLTAVLGKLVETSGSAPNIILFYPFRSLHFPADYN